MLMDDGGYAQGDGRQHTWSRGGRERESVLARDSGLGFPVDAPKCTKPFLSKINTRVCKSKALYFNTEEHDIKAHE